MEARRHPGGTLAAPLRHLAPPRTSTSAPQHLHLIQTYLMCTSRGVGVRFVKIFIFVWSALCCWRVRVFSSGARTLLPPASMRVAALATLLLHGAAAVVMPRSRSNVVCRMPSLSPLPPALAASDGSHTFTYDSVQYAPHARTPTSRRRAQPRHGAPGRLTRLRLALDRRRLPLIIESVIESNAYDAATVGALRGLAGEITASYYGSTDCGYTYHASTYCGYAHQARSPPARRLCRWPPPQTSGPPLWRRA